MADVPNLEVLKGIVNKINEEFDLEVRLKRYTTASPELVSEASSLGLSKNDDATRALFVTDFIVTASEFPPGKSDEDRRKSIINTFIKALSQRNKSSDVLTKIYYLAYKTAVLIRRADIFMAGRGLDRDTGLFIIQDIYLEPYLRLCSEILGKGSCGWELGIITAALKRTSPDDEIEIFKGVPEYTDRSTLVPFFWKLLKEYSYIQKVEVNTNVVIPNIATTSTIFAGKTKSDTLFSLWNLITAPTSLRDNKKQLDSLFDFVTKNDKEKPLIYLRGTIKETKENIIFVRNLDLESNPILLLKTTADEINTSEALTILGLRGKDIIGWKNADNFKAEVKTQKTSEPVPSNELNKPQKPQEQQLATDNTQKKKGFFSKLIEKIFSGSGSKKNPDTQKQEPTTGETKQKQSSTVTKITSSGRDNLPLYLSHALTINIVGDLHLFEIFDTIREFKYSVVGILESDYGKGETKLFTTTKFDNPKSLMSLLDGLDTILEETVNHFFGKKHQVIPREILFISTNEQRFAISFESDDKRIVGTIGQTYSKDIADWRAKDEEPIQRRTLQMRTGQLLSARHHTPLDEAIKRIYGEDFSKKTTETILDHPILTLK